MPKNIKCKNCNNLKHHWCEIVIDSPDEDMIRDCTHFWEKTNADRIRAMSDEELATDLLDMFQEICEDGVPCTEWMVRWLKQPAQEDL